MLEPKEWQAARDELLAKEKELTRALDALAAERRRSANRLAGAQHYYAAGR
ncbi:DUF899 family protein [Nocardia sp. NPDC051990]|uniref:DUF899 family protein n=1 Tax=Nocardia sp. NPDC051990 TaxID=3155285 RepID=UPI00342D806C